MANGQRSQSKIKRPSFLHRLLTVSIAGAFLVFGVAAGNAAPAGLPRPRHVVVVIKENHAYQQIIGVPSTP
jgi:acid phosphatase